MNVYVVTEHLLHDLFIAVFNNSNDAIKFALEYAMKDRKEWFYTEDKTMNVFQINLNQPANKFDFWTNQIFTKEDLQGE